MNKINVGLDGCFVKELKMSIKDMNEYLFEEYGSKGFHTQKLAKNIYLYLIGNYNEEIENWFCEYGHLFIGWNNIKKTYEKVWITYQENKVI